VLLDHLGDILWALGKTEEAIERWRRAFWNAGEGDEDVRTTVPEKLNRAGAPLEEGGEGDGEEGDGEEGEE
jgi:predicted negative regulator of RcsB-dependent stress response